jgi:hypothetical protein
MSAENISNADANLQNVDLAMFVGNPTLTGQWNSANLRTLTSIGQWSLSRIAVSSVISFSLI